MLASAGIGSSDVLTKFTEFIRFSSELGCLDGREILESGEYRRRTSPSFTQYLRSEDELRLIVGSRVLGETRYNADGKLDVIRWARPQNDGPALRALTTIRYFSQYELDAETKLLGEGLLHADLDYTARHSDDLCFDPWEEESGRHYYTQLVQSVALQNGAMWVNKAGDTARAERYLLASAKLRDRLDRHWSAQKGHYLSRLDVRNGSPDKLLDISTLLGVLHAGLVGGAHSILDPRVHATWFALEQLFDATYEINRDSPPGFGPAMGRYHGDVYYSGGAYYFSTLGAAELYFRLAATVDGGARIPVSEVNAPFLDQLINQSTHRGFLPSDDSQRAQLVEALVARGDAMMATVRRYTPASGDLSEQFDRITGEQVSAKRLTWSYAAFLTAFAARGQIGMVRGGCSK
ncbi:MAG: glucan 1,4-alpha-glucosidase [Proteobacteria bacterium]|nr:MAG: glucan 1,4-alpha-glucosidase [Pseudomonadota bacterium]